jgi:hypothetical protein
VGASENQRLKIVVALVVTGGEGSEVHQAGDRGSRFTEEEAHYYCIIRMPTREGHRQIDRQTNITRSSTSFHPLTLFIQSSHLIDYSKQIPKL